MSGTSQSGPSLMEVSVTKRKRDSTSSEDSEDSLASVPWTVSRTRPDTRPELARMLSGIEHVLTRLKHSDRSLRCFKLVDGHILNVLFPTVYWRCRHKPIPKNAKRLGFGAFGNVVQLNKRFAAKHFVDTTDLIHEILASELVKEGMKVKGQVLDLAIALNAGACIKCKVLFFPLKRFSLQRFGPWVPKNVPQLVAHFKGLQSAVQFLNNKCGLFHADIDPSNILVEQTPDPSDLGRLYISDFGIASIHGGNPVHDIRVCDDMSAFKYKMIYQRSASEFGKRTYRPFMVVAYIYQRMLFPEMYDPYGDGPIPPFLAYKLDMLGVAYSLLYCMCALTDVTNQGRVFDMYVRKATTKSGQLLQSICPKTVILQLLSDYWQVPIDVGLTSEGSSSTPVKLKDADRLEFIKFATQTKKQFANSQFFQNQSILENQELRDLFLDLIKHDRFDVTGK